MGCRNACICGGRCSDSCYEPERYCGEAEDLYDELYGSREREEDEYIEAMEEQYYRDMEEQCLKDSSQNMEDK